MMLVTIYLCSTLIAPEACDAAMAYRTLEFELKTRSHIECLNTAADRLNAISEQLEDEVHFRVLCKSTEEL